MKRFMLLLGVGMLALFLSRGAHCGLQPPPTPVRPTERAAEGTATEEHRLSREISGALESVDGLPVPIYPGTRVTEAEVRPPQRSRKPSETPKTPLPPDHRVVAGRLSAGEERAVADARLLLGREVADWLAPDVPPQWKPPAHLIDAMVARTRTRPVVKDYGILYETTLQVNFSGQRRAEIIDAYQRELVARRLGLLGGGLGFVLACLATVSGYIRADEATKGYYTNWLRLASAAGVGAAGVLIYQMLA